MRAGRWINLRHFRYSGEYLIDAIALGITEIQGSEDLHQFCNGGVLDNFWSVARFLLSNVLKRLFAFSSCFTKSDAGVCGFLDCSFGFCVWVIADQDAFDGAVEYLGVVFVLNEDKDATAYFTHVRVVRLPVVKDDGFLASLIVLRQNDKWWTQLAEEIDYSHNWSISAATSIAWVVIAYVFSVLDTFIAGVDTSIHSNGLGVGSLWLWLLPIVVGWLQFSPKCDAALLKKAVAHANDLAYLATDDGKSVLLKDKTDIRAIDLTLTDVDDLHRDEKCTSPVFNYARFFPWVQAVEDVSEAFQAASERFRRHEPVNEPVDPDAEKPNYRDRVGTRTQVEKYCTAEKPPARGRWGPKVVSRMFLASGLALMLQWGTAGAAFVQAWYTPTRGENFTLLSPPSCLLITVTGLGCRSLAVLIYAVLSTTVWMMLVTSSILTHYASNPQHRSEGHVIHEGEARDEEGQALLEDKAIRHRSTARWISIMLRRLGKLIAGFNAVWAVTACFCQFGNVFDNCFCNSSVFSLGKHAYSVITLQDLDFWIIQSAWIGSVFLAGATAAIYVLFANFLIEPPLPEIVPVATE
ncbi:uncharacterized protein LACBIDRAFT_335951 [Laccaria bicolor S238N-H82]|uniref:Predicted protein n=1 Tax=Laccaria bicolor (strain S238N-H82 / ATCC MYA-4686) TaxID=486041 RepID=B0E3X7_LACBS|nr:uncharacterized protein LACBIDRAFT_335951 [Laccaria bicolor S238N-H82]EDQ98457.1 predicted protein [Laccaria bicolor S238N-H82]|eukprot:XP_001890893.1 predicted protein [Laccaria bicolor S238N-H82]